MNDPTPLDDVERIERPVSLVAQVEKTLRRAIAETEFPDGRLPTAVELAERLGVSRETVRLALDSLQSEGLLVKRRRRGTFIKSASVPERLPVPGQDVFGYLQADYGDQKDDPEAVTRSFSSTMLEGALVEAGRHGYSLVVRSARPSELRKAFSELRSFGNLRGVIFASIAEEKLLKRFGGLSIPAVLLDHDLNVPRLSSIRADSMQNAKLAVSHLVKLGHRRIACAQWQQVDLNPWFSRGYCEAMREAGLRRRKVWELSVPLNRAGASAAMSQLMAMSPRPTAIVCFNNTFASFTIDAANQRGLSIPSDLSVFGGGGERVVGLTCNQMDWLNLGGSAAKILLKAVELGDDYQPIHTTTPYQLETGSTTAEPNC